MNLWLDDLRTPPHGWTWIRSVAEAQRVLLAGEVEHASLDHDLGHGCEGGCWDDSGDVTVQRCGKACACGCHATGYDLTKWMAETGIWPRLSCRVHSANPAGALSMQATINRYAPY